MRWPWQKIKSDPLLLTRLERIKTAKATAEYLLSRPDYDPTRPELHEEHIENILNDTFDPFGDGYGPRINITTTCFGCVYMQKTDMKLEISGRESVHEISYTCLHPKGQGALKSSDSTPEWCPYVDRYFGIKTKQFKHQLTANKKGS